MTLSEYSGFLWHRLGASGGLLWTRVPWKAGNFLTSWVTIIVSGRTLLRGVTCKLVSEFSPMFVKPTQIWICYWKVGGRHGLPFSCAVLVGCSDCLSTCYRGPAVGWQKSEQARRIISIVAVEGKLLHFTLIQLFFCRKPKFL